MLMLALRFRHSTFLFYSFADLARADLVFFVLVFSEFNGHCVFMVSLSAAFSLFWLHLSSLHERVFGSSDFIFIQHFFSLFVVIDVFGFCLFLARARVALLSSCFAHALPQPNQRIVAQYKARASWRATEYKRATMIFSDLEKLKEVKSQDKIQLIFAGKAHPKDEMGKNFIKDIYEFIDRLKGEIEIVYLMKNSIGKVAYYFNTHRMMRRYATDAYL
jgi:hypothetical protein